jgi:hypothetical protein
MLRRVHIRLTAPTVLINCFYYYLDDGDFGDTGGGMDDPDY